MKRLIDVPLGSAEIYIPEGQHHSVGVGSERYVAEYDYWHLVLQPDEDQLARGLGAGLAIAKRPVRFVTELHPEEWANLGEVVKTAPQQLCEKAGLTYMPSFVLAANEGEQRGQTQAQVHFHLYPNPLEDRAPEGFRNGIGAAMEALRATRPDLNQTI